MVFRDSEDAVQFTEINPVTARLLAILAAEPTRGDDACRQIAAELQHPSPSQLLTHGAALLDDLRRQGIILGSLS